MTIRTSSRRRAAAPPAPASRAFYLAQAEACLGAAAAANDAGARRLHEDECKLWLMLARQREAIEAVLDRYLDPVGVASYSAFRKSGSGFAIRTRSNF
jgi:hypothetical protein